MPNGDIVADNAFGTANSLIDNPYLFTGQRFDEETGLYYFRARYYDADQGRFINRDPLGYVDGMNLYEGYFIPNGIDPYGLWTWWGVAQGALDFTRGAADALTFGLTRAAREAIHGERGEVINETAYVAGEITETVIEVAVTAGGATLRHAARKAVQEATETAIEKGYKTAGRELLEQKLRRQARKVVNAPKNVPVHHKNPLFGHPAVRGGRGSKPSRYPTAGFPSLANSRRNLEIIERDKMHWLFRNTNLHDYYHRRAFLAEQIDRARELTILTRQGINRLRMEDGGCNQK